MPIFAAAASMALLLGGCAASVDNASDAEPSSSATAEDPWASVPGGTNGPLDEVLGWAHGADLSPQDQADGEIEKMRDREQVVADCMAAQGFEYTPELPEPDSLVVSDGPPPGSPEFLRSYGYGVWQEHVPRPGGVSWNSGEGAQENRDRVDAMSQAEREAYLIAMHGDVTFIDENTWSSDDSATGCWDEGDALSNPRPQEEAAEAIYQAAWEYMMAVPENSALDGLHAEWAACMRDEGWAYASPTAAAQHFRDTLQEQERTGLYRDQWPEDLVTDMVEEELAVANADLACREKTDYVARYNEIDENLQAEYVEDHQGDLIILGETAG